MILDDYRLFASRLKLARFERRQNFKSKYFLRILAGSVLSETVKRFKQLVDYDPELTSRLRKVLPRLPAFFGAAWKRLRLNQPVFRTGLITAGFLLVIIVVFGSIASNSQSYLGDHPIAPALSFDGSVKLPVTISSANQVKFSYKVYNYNDFAERYTYLIMLTNAGGTTVVDQVKLEIPARSSRLQTESVRLQSKPNTQKISVQLVGQDQKISFVV